MRLVPIGLLSFLLLPVPCLAGEVVGAFAGDTFKNTEAGPQYRRFWQVRADGAVRKCRVTEDPGHPFTGPVFCEKWVMPREGEN